MSLNTTVSKDVQKVINKLQLLPKDLNKKERKRILRQAAKPLVKKTKTNIKDAPKVVHRYSNGRKVASYFPGNLRRSIRTLSLRKTAAVFVGPRIAKGQTKGIFRGNRVDGWYGHIIEKGSREIQGIHYLERAYRSTQNQVLNIITEETKQVVKNYIKKVRSFR